jgi:hypothetical protein
MGRLNNGPNGGFSGKAGSYIGYNWKGGSYIRGLPKIKKDREPTPNQLAARKKFAFLNMWLKLFTRIISITFRTYSPKMTGMMAAYSCNAKNVLGEYPDFRIDFPNFVVSYGELAGAVNPRACFNPEGTIDFQWDSEYDSSRGSTLDTALLLAFIPEKVGACMNLDSRREMNSGKLPVAAHNRGKVAEVYLVFMSFDRLKCSKSQYLGQVIMAQPGSEMNLEKLSASMVPDF